MIVRGESLSASMSHYLIDQIAENEHMTVETRSEVAALHGTDDLESIDIADRRAGVPGCPGGTRPRFFFMIGGAMPRLAGYRRRWLVTPMATK